MSDDTPLEPESELEDTQIFEEPLATPQDEWFHKLPRIVEREVILDDNGQPRLVVRTVESRRVGKLRKRRQYRVVEDSILLEDSSRVEKDLAPKLKFKPATGETTIHCLMRLSWWSHGPAQIGLFLCGIIGPALVIALMINSGGNIEVPASLIMLGVVLFWLILGSVYFTVWMKWAYRYLVITDRRIGLVYCPPFSLPGVENFASLANIETTEAKDQNWAANLLGKINPAYRFGKLANDTAAQSDEWMREIKFVREHTTVAETILRLTLHEELPRETDDMRKSRELQDLANIRFLEIHGKPS